MPGPAAEVKAGAYTEALIQRVVPIGARVCARAPSRRWTAAPCNALRPTMLDPGLSSPGNAFSKFLQMKRADC